MVEISHARRVRRRRQGWAIASAGLAVGVVSVATLAAWNDAEWVFGGTSADGGDGVGTSTFEVQQSAWESDVPTVASTFADFETNPGGELFFDVDPSGLTPGTTIYAPVALTSTADSIGGTLTLQPPVAATGQTAVDTGGLLWNNLTYSVRVTDDATTAEECRTDFSAAGTAIVTDAALTATPTITSQTLDAERGNVQYYCFAVTLPDNATTQTLQGRVVFPSWRFHAVSD